ncbi:hypothetical protein [Oceanobacillus neutriphilus]|uniref:Uncharacterized protein n=1 Tax=Oceanobacillus neutriphilus TaxID=531815 RepID=A0ABQ2P3I5_9BACI|nr:hypothetical protein [Oceanobacillus neutriphilus]GGP17382.1 hypothetical protein GCM10011346_52870 [Oceanobacillus neutriphilus]
MKYGIFIPGLPGPLETYDSMFEAYEAAKYAAEETDIFHEVKEVD